MKRTLITLVMLSISSMLFAGSVIKPNCITDDKLTTASGVYMFQTRPHIVITKGRGKYYDGELKQYPIFDLIVTSSTLQVVVYDLKPEQYKEVIGILVKYSGYFGDLFKDAEIIHGTKPK